MADFAHETEKNTLLRAITDVKKGLHAFTFSPTVQTKLTLDRAKYIGHRNRRKTEFAGSNSIPRNGEF